MKITSKKTVSVQHVLFFVISVLCFSITTIAAEMENIAQTANLAPLKGTFSQSKNIKPLKRPFKSEGGFVYLPNTGLLWHTKKPVNSLKLFANDGVYRLDEQGIMQKEAQFDNDFFLALFAVDEQKLAKYFTTKVLQDETNYQASCLALTPISETMQSLFKQINLCMNEIKVCSENTESTKSVTAIPTKIVLIEAKGNKTEIQLQLSSEKVSQEELAYFD